MTKPAIDLGATWWCRLLCVHPRWERVGMAVSGFEDTYRCTECGTAKDFPLHSPPVNWIGTVVDRCRW